MDAIAETIFQQLQTHTRATSKNCRQVAGRIADEASRICAESQRIQQSGDIQAWELHLAKHRLQQCLRYYRLGSEPGRAELHSTLSAIVYRYIAPSPSYASYQTRLMLIEDFLQGFYLESLNAFRREAQLSDRYSPRSLLELAEYMAFTERYAKRRIRIAHKRSQQLIVLRAQTFSQQHPPETSVDIDRACDGVSSENGDATADASLQQLRDALMNQEPELSDDSLRQKVIAELLQYLEEKQQHSCVDYFCLRLQDLSAAEIEAILGLTPRQRDYLQQRFKYHLIRFALMHRWELVHQWLGADLDRNLGLTPSQQQEFHAHCTPEEEKLLQFKKQNYNDAEIAKELGCTTNQLQKKWFKLLERAWDLRNHEVITK
ncbi:heterocyst differentiation protein HetZ [Geitlerinema sp. PCC 9228]|uniref:heterocyst differentiation protein HetZ n=1 Tax=Geitlerinema sp. PCC 9228 TaxID=111611 RepID=UPI0008F9C307|nr:heterocyst differentiation protein HetZ [Geitlerinema sp. PCC 9228]